MGGGDGASNREVDDGGGGAEFGDRSGVVKAMVVVVQVVGGVKEKFSWRW